MEHQAVIEERMQALDRKESLGYGEIAAFCKAHH